LRQVWLGWRCGLLAYELCCFRLREAVWLKRRCLLASLRWACLSPRWMAKRRVGLSSL
jgi:hypothetical protein